MVVLHGFIRKSTDGKKTPRREIVKVQARRGDGKKTALDA
jgi:hypothetical protein